MALKSFKPTTPTRRHTVLIDRRELSKVAPHKPLVTSLKSKAGKNSSGKVTMRHKGGGVKKNYRIIDSKRDKFNIPAIVETIEYDPNRTAFIALLKYADGERRYIIAPNGLKVGETLMSGLKDIEIKSGNAMPLKEVPQGMFVYSVELYPGKGAVIAKSGGTSVQVMGGDKGYIQLKMPSGEYRLVRETCMATIGQASNPDQKNVKYGKAGRKRRMGVRPTVRGVAMSIDHPHGGGQGKGGRHGTGGPKKDLWGNTVGTRTRKGRKVTNKFIIRRRSEKNKFKAYKTVI